MQENLIYLPKVGCKFELELPDRLHKEGNMILDMNCSVPKTKKKPFAQERHNYSWLWDHGEICPCAPPREGTVETSNLSCVLPGRNTRYRGGLFTAPSLVPPDCTGQNAAKAAAGRQHAPFTFGERSEGRRERCWGGGVMNQADAGRKSCTDSSKVNFLFAFALAPNPSWAGRHLEHFHLPHPIWIRPTFPNLFWCREPDQNWWSVHQTRVSRCPEGNERSRQMGQSQERCLDGGVLRGCASWLVKIKAHCYWAFQRAPVATGKPVRRLYSHSFIHSFIESTNAY